MNPINYLKRAAGSDLEGVARLRLGRGVVGNTTYAFYALAAAGAAITWALRDSPGMAILAVGGLIIAFLVYLFGTYVFARWFPDMAMLGDSEWLALRQSEMASKNNSRIPTLPPTTDPTRPEIEDVALLDAPDQPQ